MASQFQLMGQRRFWPFFWTSFLTSFNDNVFKQGLVSYIVLLQLEVVGLAPGALVAASTVIIILPYVLFSATAGQVCDRTAKAGVVRWVKLAEIVIMAVGLFGLLTRNMELLLVVLFLTGLQSTFFGPAKYSFLPEVLDDDELVSGNALIEMGTFLSILLGIIAGGTLIGVFGANDGPLAVGVAVVSIAIVGAVVATLIERRPASSPELRVSINPITPNLELFRVARSNETAFLSIMGISWFWFVGTGLLALIGQYSTNIFGTNPYGLNYLTGLFCVGIGLGSMLCDRLSRDRLELGLVPFGSMGMSLFLLDLFLVGPTSWMRAGAPSLDVSAFLSTFTGWRISFDLLVIALFGGFFTVPLFTLIQRESPDEVRSRVIAGNNLINSVFMLLAGGMITVLLAQKVPVSWVYLVLSVMNIAVAWYIYHLLPTFMWRFVVWVVTNVLYRVEVTGAQNIPKEGPVVLVCNHPTFVDFLFMASVCKRPPRFLMYHTFMQMPLVGWLFRDAKVIPIAPRAEDSKVMEQAFDEVAEALAAEGVVCIFPEGMVSRDGELNPFRPGIEKMIARTPAPVVPIALIGMWGSFFSYFWGKPLSKPFQRFRSKVKVAIGEPMAPEKVTAAGLAKRVADLGGWAVPPSHASAK
ncbi:MAG: MFS transporter [Myxococcota bacterium]